MAETTPSTAKPTTTPAKEPEAEVSQKELSFLQADKFEHSRTGSST